MKVYVVVYSSFWDYSSIERIFTNENQAKAWADKHNQDYIISQDDDAMYIVQEHEVLS